MGEPNIGHVLTLDCAERFMRVHVVTPDEAAVTERLREDFGLVAERFTMTWRIERVDVRRRVLIMVSKFHHCLNDLLYRARTDPRPGRYRRARPRRRMRGTGQRGAH